jgi:hypothetical protein
MLVRLLIFTDYMYMYVFIQILLIQLYYIYDYFSRKQAENNYDIITGTRYASSFFTDCMYMYVCIYTDFTYTTILHIRLFSRKQAENEYDIVTGTRYAQGGGVRYILACVYMCICRGMYIDKYRSDNICTSVWFIWSYITMTL